MLAQRHDGASHLEDRREHRRPLNVERGEQGEHLNERKSDRLDGIRILDVALVAERDADEHNDGHNGAENPTNRQAHIGPHLGALFALVRGQARSAEAVSARAAHKAAVFVAAVVPAPLGILFDQGQVCRVVCAANEFFGEGEVRGPEAGWWKRAACKRSRRRCCRCRRWVSVTAFLGCFGEDGSAACVSEEWWQHI